ncbi:MAG: hypothetical protein ACRD3W_29180 [Terriglobales bacterium]
MKHLLLLLSTFLLTASVNIVAARSASDSIPAAKHSAVVDMPKVIDLSRADPTTWPVPSASSAPSGKSWRYFDEYRVAGD